jgi:hypothetical protein
MDLTKLIASTFVCLQKISHTEVVLFVLTVKEYSHASAIINIYTFSAWLVFI